MSARLLACSGFTDFVLPGEARLQQRNVLKIASVNVFVSQVLAFVMQLTENVLIIETIAEILREQNKA